MVLTTFYTCKTKKDTRGGCKDRNTMNPIGRLGVGSPAVSEPFRNLPTTHTSLQRKYRLLGNLGVGLKGPISHLHSSHFFSPMLLRYSLRSSPTRLRNSFSSLSFENSFRNSSMATWISPLHCLRTTSDLVSFN